MSPFFSQPGWKTGVFQGTTYRYLTHKSEHSNKPTLLLLHGFPSGPLTFREMVPILKAEGYSFIIPELLGYGETDRPKDHKEYARKKLSDELVAILDKEGVQKAIVFGHDHGSTLASSFVRIFPERSAGLVLASVSYSPPSPTGFNVDVVQPLLTPHLGYENFGYWKTFLKPDSYKLVDDHIESFVTLMYSKNPTVDWKTHFCPPGALEETLKKDLIFETVDFFSDEEKDEFIDYLKKSGTAGPIAWYLATADPEINKDIETSITKRLALPYLFLQTNKDVAIPPMLAARQKMHCDDLSTAEFETGHWVCEEDPKGVVRAIDAWVKAKAI